MVESAEELMEEIRGRLSAIEASLPRELDILAVSPRSKLPFKALSYRETLIWRMAELSRTAYEVFAAGRLASAIPYGPKTHVSLVASPGSYHCGARLTDFRKRERKSQSETPPIIVFLVALRWVFSLLGDSLLAV